jgi:hypothetical protein
VRVMATLPSCDHEVDVMACPSVVVLGETGVGGSWFRKGSPPIQDEYETWKGVIVSRPGECEVLVL